MALTGWDDYFIHQIQDTIDAMATDDPNAYERTFVCCHNTEGTLQLITGVGVYPNANVMDGFVCVRHKGSQRNIRVSRHLKGDRTNMQVGPLSFKVLEPLTRWGIYLGDNDYGIGCSLEFEGRTAPLWRGWAKRERIESGYAGFDQHLRFKGSITFEDQLFNADGFLGGRDHTWGIRIRGSVTKGVGFFLWGFPHFSNFGVHIVCAGRLDGATGTGRGAILNDDGSVIPIVDIRHRIEFIPGFSFANKKSNSYSKIELRLTDANGKERLLICKPISSETSEVGAGYDELHGLDRGPFHVEGERWDVSRPVGVESPSYGMHQRVNEFELDGEPGVGLLESYFNRAPTWQYKSNW